MRPIRSSSRFSSGSAVSLNGYLFAAASAAASAGAAAPRVLSDSRAKAAPEAVVTMAVSSC